MCAQNAPTTVADEPRSTGESRLSYPGRSVLVIVDQPASIGALAIAVARSLGIDVAYLPRLAMRRIAYLHPGEGKTETPTSSLTPPGLCRTLCAGSEPPKATSAAYWTCLPQPQPPMRYAPWAVGPSLTCGHHAPQLAMTLPAKLALEAQTVLVPGTSIGHVIAGVAVQLRDVRREQASLAADLEARLEAHPLAEALTSMPSVGFRTTIKILTIVGDGSPFPPRATLPPTPDWCRSPGDRAPRSKVRPGRSAATTP
jgi:hypothetical protein